MSIDEHEELRLPSNNLFEVASLDKVGRHETTLDLCATLERQIVMDSGARKAFLSFPKEFKQLREIRIHGWQLEREDILCELIEAFSASALWFGQCGLRSCLLDKIIGQMPFIQKLGLMDCRRLAGDNRSEVWARSSIRTLSVCGLSQFVLALHNLGAVRELRLAYQRVSFERDLQKAGTSIQKLNLQDGVGGKGLIPFLRCQDSLRDVELIDVDTTIAGALARVLSSKTELERLLHLQFRNVTGKFVSISPFPGPSREVVLGVVSSLEDAALVSAMCEDLASKDEVCPKTMLYWTGAEGRKLVRGIQRKHDRVPIMSVEWIENL